MSCMKMCIRDRTHIGYTSWDEPKGGNIMPKVTRVDVSRNGNMAMGGYEYEEKMCIRDRRNSILKKVYIPTENRQ